MRGLRILGNAVKVEERKSNKDSVDFTDGKIFISSCKRSKDDLLKEFLEDLLHTQLCKIYDEIRDEGKIELFGNLDFEILERIDGKKERIAKLKGKKILVKLSAVASPEGALKYVVAHEIAHLFTTRHSKKFWKILGTIYPDFEEGQKLFVKYQNIMTGFINLFN